MHLKQFVVYFFNRNWTGVAQNFAMLLFVYLVYGDNNNKYIPCIFAHHPFLRRNRLNKILHSHQFARPYLTLTSARVCVSHVRSSYENILVLSLHFAFGTRQFFKPVPFRTRSAAIVLKYFRKNENDSFKRTRRF